MSFCVNCGADKGQAAFCSNCGQGPGAAATTSVPSYQAPYSTAPPAVAAKKTNGFAIASFVLSLVCGSLLAIIFGHVALSQINKRGDGGKGLAIAGLVIGYVTFGVIIVSLLAAAGSSGGGY